MDAESGIPATENKKIKFKFLKSLVIKKENEKKNSMVAFMVKGSVQWWSQKQMIQFEPSAHSKIR